MEFYLLLHVFFTLVTLCLVGLGIITHAASPPQLYWKSMLPNTPMPKPISDLLHPAVDWMDMEEKSASVKIGEGGANVDAGKGKKPEGGGHIVKDKGNHGVHVSVSPYIYTYAASPHFQTQLQAHPNSAQFFLEKDLRQGTQMGLRFTEASSNKAQFLPRDVAQSIPFSSDKIEAILKRFPAKAEMVKNTIKECEARGIRGEQKYCATSLESMIDFAISKLGRNIRAVYTMVEEKEKEKTENYRIGPGKVKLNKNGEGIVVCHKQDYPYAVFYCHYTKRIRGYRVRMEGVEGGRVARGVAICHTDTSEWNPKHMAFQVLKVKPGKISVCHFLPDDHLVWVPNY